MLNEKEQMQAIKFLRQIAILGLVTYGLMISFKNAASAAALWDPNRPFNNPVDRWEKRILRVKNFIPAEVPALGYVADWDLPGVQYSEIDQDAEYMITQYTLAPIPVKPGFDQEWIIGNFTIPGFEDWLDQQMQSYEITKLDHGIYIIHRTTP